MMSKWKQISSLVRSKALVPSSLPSTYTFTPNKEEVIESRFRLRYSTTCNSYYRDWSDAIDPSSQGVISGWDKVLYSVDSVHRQINEEAGQVYLERVPGANTGCIKWRINFGCCGLLVDEVTIRLSCVEDYGGEVVATLMGTPEQKRVRYPIGSDYVTYTELENSSELTLTIHFVGEPGQVTRLFPQSILRGMGYPLDIRVILKPPLQSLGRPRILVGLLYSSSQENEVDGRHYKQNTTNTGQGFLHIHLLRGMDLPQGKHGLPEPFSKCYLLPDAKKSTKCRTKARKGKDPLWNEQFLIVGVNFHDVKRRALEICIADSHTSVGKKAKLLGGVRLSLGYKAVVAQQTKQVSQVLRFLKGKGGVGEGRKIDNEEIVETRERKVSFSDKDTVIANVNSSFPRWKRASGKPLKADNTDKGEKEEIDADNADAEANNNTGEEQITVNEPATNDENSNNVTKTGVTENEQQSASSTSTEDMAAAWDPLPDPTTNSEPESASSRDASPAEKVDREKERSAEERLFYSVLTSIKQLEIAARSSVTLEPSEEKELQLCYEGDKQDELRGTDSCFMVTKGSLNEDLMKEDFEKQESQEILTEIINSEGEQEKSGLKKNEIPQEGDLSNDDKKADEINEGEKGDFPQLAEQSHDEDDLKMNGSKKIEIQGNGDLVNERYMLNDTREAYMISKTELESENPADSKEQNGNEFSTKVKEAVIKEKSTKEDSSMSSVVTETLGAEKTLEGKYSSNSELRNQETEVVVSQRNEHTKTQRALKRTSSGSDEMKRIPSFTLKDFAKKISPGRRSRSGSEETGSETGLETSANKVMLDAEGLEITQWTLVVDRPKQWHYCWHILRPEMTILH